MKKVSLPCGRPFCSRNTPWSSVRVTRVQPHPWKRLNHTESGAGESGQGSANHPPVRGGVCGSPCSSVAHIRAGVDLLKDVLHTLSRVWSFSLSSTDGHEKAAVGWPHNSMLYRFVVHDSLSMYYHTYFCEPRRPNDRRITLPLLLTKNTNNRVPQREREHPRTQVSEGFTLDSSHCEVKVPPLGQQNQGEAHSCRRPLVVDLIMLTLSLLFCVSPVAGLFAQAAEQEPLLRPREGVRRARGHGGCSEAQGDVVHPRRGVQRWRPQARAVRSHRGR